MATRRDRHVVQGVLRTLRLRLDMAAAESSIKLRPVAGLDQAAQLLQATLRMQLARSSWRRREAAITIQRHARGAATRRKGEQLRAPQLVAALLRAAQRQRPVQQRLQVVSELQESGVPSTRLQGLRDECSDLAWMAGLLHAVRLRCELSALEFRPFLCAQGDLVSAKAAETLQQGRRGQVSRRELHTRRQARASNAV